MRWHYLIPKGAEEGDTPLPAFGTSANPGLYLQSQLTSNDSEGGEKNKRNHKQHPSGQMSLEEENKYRNSFLMSAGNS